eukprot:CAMPEP_0179344390 /NCGR_PEP_ID=MMETSP0797-20121207/71485_1 /TAXON_ID=47934 /ORGANISM="Dinophysis acuminata, Strain DAEP01" /LENGTH=38 /DNA_ID= /DNA_START= /DNA_END= /DNA_ORIENTATION=
MAIELDLQDIWQSFRSPRRLPGLPSQTVVRPNDSYAAM